LGGGGGSFPVGRGGWADRAGARVVGVAAPERGVFVS
jgi:hypothetical protein